MSDHDHTEHSSASSLPSSTLSNNSLPTSTTTVPISPPLPPKAEEKSLGTAISLEDLPSEQRNLAEALFAAVEEADAEVVEELIAGGAPLNVKDNNGYTPLLHTVRNRFFEPRYGGSRSANESANNFKRLVRDYFPILAALLKNREGREAAYQANTSGTTPLIAAITTKRIEAVTALLATPQGRATVKQTYRYGNPLSQAFLWDPRAIIPLLLTPEGRAIATQQYLLFESSYINVIPMAALLIIPAVCATINQTDPSGKTPLAAAAQRYDTDTGVMLLLQGANFEMAKNWLTTKGSEKNLPKEEAEKYAKALTNLTLIQRSYQEELTTFADGQERNLENWLTYKAQETPYGAYAEALANLKLVKESYQYELTVNGPNKSIENWLTYKAQQELTLQKRYKKTARQETTITEDGDFLIPVPAPEFDKTYAEALANLKLINGYYQTELTTSAQTKLETKQEVSKDAPETKESKHASIQTTESSQPIAQIQQIQNDLAEGNTEALLKQLQQPAEAGSKMHDYLQQEALTDILYAQAAPKVESKDSQQAKTGLAEAMETLLQKDPATVIRPNKEEDGLTPLDIALQLNLPKEVVGKLQQAAQAEYNRQNEELLKKLEARAQDSQTNPRDKEAYLELVSLQSQSMRKVKEMRDQLGKPQSTSSSVSTTPAPTPLTNTAAPVVNMVVGLSKAQKAQIALGRQLLNIKLTKVLTEALAIKYKLVDGFNQSRVGTAAEGGLKLVADLLPIPGAGMMAKAIVAGAKKTVEKRDLKQQEHRLGEISTIDQAAERIAALVKSLTRRFQLVFAQLNPESLEIFVERVVDRMNDYWDRLPKRAKKSGLDPQALRQLLSEGLVDGTKPLPKPSGQALSQHQQFENLLENMVLGVSLCKDREVKATSRFAKVTARQGRVGEIAGLAAGDRTVKYQTLQGAKEVAVQHICRNAPVVTWAGITDDLDEPVYHDGHAPAKIQVDPDLPSLYLQKTECKLRGYIVDQNTAAPVALPIPPKEFDVDPMEQLKQQLAAAEARAVELEEQVEEVAAQQRPLRQELIAAQGRILELEQGQVQVAPGDSKSTTPPRSNADPRMFKTLASSPLPVPGATPKPPSPKQPNELSSSTTTTSSTLTGSL